MMSAHHAECLKMSKNDEQFRLKSDNLACFHEVHSAILHLQTKLTSKRRKGVSMLEQGKRFLVEEQAVGVVEVILILVVLIGLVIIFKQQLTTLVNTIFKKISSQSSSI